MLSPLAKLFSSAYVARAGTGQELTATLLYFMIYNLRFIIEGHSRESVYFQVIHRFNKIQFFLFDPKVIFQSMDEGLR